MRIKKNTLYIAGIFLILIISGYIFLMPSTGTQSITGNIVLSDSQEDFQIVKLSVQGGTYVLSPNTLKKDIPVRLQADEILPGCSRAVVIPSFNVKKTFSQKGDYVDFTPNKAGTFTIACSMYMYTGQFNVLDSDGSKSNYVEPISKSSGASCGASGGCGGCGG